MPLVIEFVLVDEAPAPSLETNASRVATAKGIVAELERQLQDPASHLRRKSALGALVSRGASVRLLGEETVDSQDSGIVRPALTEALGLPAPSPGAQAPGEDRGARDGDAFAAPPSPGASSPQAPAPSPSSAPRAAGPAQRSAAGASSPTTPAAAAALNHDVASLGARTAVCAGPREGLATVPRILDFPKPPARPTVVSGGYGLFKSIFDWIPSCSPAAPCGGAAMDACTLIIPDSEFLKPCVSAPAALGAEKAAAGGPEEAGLGGWPLCVPNAAVACPPRRPDEAGQAPLAAPQNGVSYVRDAPSLPCSLRGAGAGRESVGALFRQAAVEVDDFELTVIFAPLRLAASSSPAAGSAQHDSAASSSASAGKVISSQAGGREPTPSTAATTTVRGGEEDAWPPAWAAHNRMVLSREGIYSFQVWPATSAGRCAKPEQLFAAGQDAPPWPHLVEVTGTPRGAPQVMSFLLAFPSAALAARVAEGLSRIRRERPSHQAKGDRGTRAGVRCELTVNATLDLQVQANVVNCAAVVRRGISEACHIGADRVRMCAVRDSARSADAAPGAAGISTAAAPPAAAPAPAGGAADGAVDAAEAVAGGLERGAAEETQAQQMPPPKEEEEEKTHAVDLAAA